MKKRILVLFALIGALTFLTGCEKVKEINVTSFELVSVNPKGLTELDALVKIGVHNPTVAFEISDATGTLNLEGSPCLSLAADQLIIAGNTDKVYSIPVRGTMAEGFNPFQLLKLINGNSLDLEKLTVDVNAKVSLRGGVGKKLELKNIKLNSLMKAKENE